MQIFTLHTIYSHNLYVHTRIRHNRLNDCGVKNFLCGGSLPSWIHRNTHDVSLVVFITVQNLVRIGRVVLYRSLFLRFGWKLPIQAVFVAIFWGFEPRSGMHH